MCVSFPTLFTRALSSVFVAVLTCLSHCWHAGRHLRTCQVELAHSDIQWRAWLGICSLRMSMCDSCWSLVQLWNLHFRCGVCVWSWCTAPMWLRVFTSSSGREGKWAMTQSQTHRGSGCRHYPEERERERNRQNMTLLRKYDVRLIEEASDVKSRDRNGKTQCSVHLGWRQKPLVYFLNTHFFVLILDNLSVKLSIRICIDMLHAYVQMFHPKMKIVSSFTYLRHLKQTYLTFCLMQNTRYFEESL